MISICFVQCSKQRGISIGALQIKQIITSKHHYIIQLFMTLNFVLVWYGTCVFGQLGPLKVSVPSTHQMSFNKSQVSIEMR